MMRIAAILGSGLMFTFLLQTPALAGDIEVGVRFTPKEVSLMQAFFRDYRVEGKGGKKAAKPLPPGIAKNLVRGKPLPPGIAKQVLPRALIVQLPPVADGYERVIVAGKILLVEIATQVIHDILVDVILD